MAHNEPPHQDLRCLQIQLFSSLVGKEFYLSGLELEQFHDKHDDVVYPWKGSPVVLPSTNGQISSFYEVGITGYVRNCIVRLSVPAHTT